MARKEHSIDEVLNSLNKKRDCKVDTENKVVEVLKLKVHDKNSLELIDNPKAKFDLGNGSWGKLDYLKNHMGYTILFVGQFLK